MILWAGLIALSCGSLSAQERWVYRYNGPASGWDEAYSVAAGTDSNLYAAGLSVGSGTYGDFTVVSLTPSGTERWVYSYNGSDNWTDIAYSAAVGVDSNVYAAGYSAESGTGNDFTVISLTPSGGERWVYSYNGPANGPDLAKSIVMGADGNLYAAGLSWGSGTSLDFAVISLTSSGGERWVYRYDGPANWLDLANWIATGADSNVYAAGVSYGMTGDDFTIISLTSQGGERWVYRYNGPGDGWDEAYSVGMGTDDNIYAAGRSTGSGTSYDFTVISLDTSGTERWVYSYNGPGNGADVANSIAMGTDGNLYAAGRSTGSGTYSDFTVISLDTSGTERWVYRYDGPADSIDCANSIVMGTDGNLYAAGYSLGSGTNHDFTVISLTPSGEERWVYSYDGSGNGDDGARSIVMGTDGHLYAAGTSVGSGTGGDFTVISLNSDVGVEEEAEARSQMPEARLEVRASPTPASSEVKICYSLPKASEARLSIHDSSGRLVRKLVNARQEAGWKTVSWDGRDSSGRRVASGVYFCRLVTRHTDGGQAGDLTATRKTVVVR